MRVISTFMASNILSALRDLMNRKSLLFFVRSTGSPLLILWALTMISDWAAWRKIWVSLTVLKCPQSIRSWSTLPAPTLGSWSWSPTRTSLVPGTMALRRASIRKISVIDISSTMITSASRGSDAFLRKRGLSLSLPSPPVYSSRRWMVFASKPVASDMRFAARPVGAQRAMLRPSMSK